MHRKSFKIKGMDCAEEVTILKRELGGLAGGEANLSFDILNGKMTIYSEEQVIDEKLVISAVARTGMEALSWDQFIMMKTGAVDDGFWQKNSRTLMCGLSAFFVILGIVIQTFIDGGLFNALTAGSETGHPFQPLAIISYILAVITGGWFIAPKAVFAARTLRPDMNLLMTIAVIGAIIIGEWLEAATVTFLFALALLLESWSVGQARRAIGALMDLSPVKARYICPNDGDIEEKTIDQVPVGVTVLVRPGEKIPLDGVVTKGITSVNQSPITGEADPVSKDIGDEVFAGTINNEGAFEFKSTKSAHDTTLANIIRLVEEAQSRRAPTEQWVEKFARYYTPLMMGFAFLVALIPPLIAGSEWGKWFYQALVILVIACPCALVISTPVSIVAGLASAARAGVLIKGGVFLEIPARLKAIALDKTGTITRGHPIVREIVPFNDHTAEELLLIAATLESQSEHPLAKAILKKAQEQNIQIRNVESFQSIKGKGAEARIDGKKYWIGSHRFMHEKGKETEEMHHKIHELEDAGHSTVAIGTDDHLCGLISIADEVRKKASTAIALLKKCGIEQIVMLTGDNVKTAGAVATVTGVDEFKANLMPEDKVNVVENMVVAKKYVAMVGDGINDAPAMAVSTLGVAMGAAGSDAAIETADVALMSDDLLKVPWLITHSRRTLRIIQQNIWVALGLKALFMALALTGYATLWMAIAADMGASLLVIFNSLRLLNSKTDLLITNEQ